MLGETERKYLLGLKSGGHTDARTHAHRATYTLHFAADAGSNVTAVGEGDNNAQSQCF